MLKIDKITDNKAIIGKQRNKRDIKEITIKLQKHDNMSEFLKENTLIHLLIIANGFTNKELKIFNYLTEEYTNNGYILVTQRELEKELNISLPLVNSTLKKLVSINMLIKSDKVYVINPQLMGNVKKSIIKIDNQLN